MEGRNGEGFDSHRIGAAEFEGRQRPAYHESGVGFLRQHRSSLPLSNDTSHARFGTTSKELEPVEGGGGECGSRRGSQREPFPLNHISFLLVFWCLH